MSSAPFPLIRPLAIPVEHGAWSFLLEPIALGLIVAPSGHGVLIAIGTIALMLLRQPLKLMLRDWSRQRYPRTAVCEALVATYALAAAITFGVAFGPALVPLLIAIPFAVTQFVFDYRNQNRQLIPELCGAIAAAPVVASIAIAGGSSMATSLAILVLARSVPAVLYVRSMLRTSVGRASARLDGLKPVPHVVIAHVLAIAVAAFISWTATAAMLLLLIRAIVPMREVRAQKVGVREIVFGAVFVGLTAVGAYM